MHTTVGQGFLTTHVLQLAWQEDLDGSPPVHIEHLAASQPRILAGCIPSNFHIPASSAGVSGGSFLVPPSTNVLAALRVLSASQVRRDVFVTAMRVLVQVLARTPYTRASAN